MHVSLRDVFKTRHRDITTKSIFGREREIDRRRSSMLLVNLAVSLSLLQVEQQMSQQAPHLLPTIMTDVEQRENEEKSMPD